MNPRTAASGEHKTARRPDEWHSERVDWRYGSWCPRSGRLCVALICRLPAQQARESGSVLMTRYRMRADMMRKCAASVVARVARGQWLSRLAGRGDRKRMGALMVVAAAIRCYQVGGLFCAPDIASFPRPLMPLGVRKYKTRHR